jgi:hypothetical protein
VFYIDLNLFGKFWIKHVLVAAGFSMGGKFFKHVLVAAGFSMGLKPCFHGTAVTDSAGGCCQCGK